MATYDTQKLLFIGHRGYAGQYPENTMAGFVAASEAGLRSIELDVRLSRDHQVMVIHDPDLERVAGIPRQVNALTCAELQSIDVGTWFSPGFSGERIPTLRQVFEQLPIDMRINVEIKPDEDRSDDTRPSIEAQVLAEVDRFRARERTLISSFNPDILRRVHQLDSALPLAVLSDADRQPDGLALCKELSAIAWNLHHTLVTHQNVTQAHRQGLKVFAFTVNTQDIYARMVAAGVDGVFSDDPPALRGSTPLGEME